MKLIRSSLVVVALVALGAMATAGAAETWKVRGAGIVRSERGAGEKLKVVADSGDVAGGKAIYMVREQRGKPTKVKIALNCVEVVDSGDHRVAYASGTDESGTTFVLQVVDAGRSGKGKDAFAWNQPGDGPCGAGGETTTITNGNYKIFSPEPDPEETEIPEPEETEAE